MSVRCTICGRIKPAYKMRRYRIRVNYAPSGIGYRYKCKNHPYPSEHQHKLEPWGMSGKKHCSVCGAVMMRAEDYHSYCPGKEKVEEWTSRRYYT